MIRITQTDSVTLATLSLDGKLLGPWVEELRVVIAAARARGAVCLNLTNLRFADAAGIALLSDVRRDGVPLAGASPLIEGLLAARQETIATRQAEGVRE